MKKEYQIVFIIGLFILTYVLDAVVEPLNVAVPTPYHYFLNPSFWASYAFTSTSIVIKTIGLVWGILWSITFIDKKYSLKAGILLVLSALMQLYALQDVATNSQVIPLEWSLSLALSGILLIIPMIIYFIRGTLSTVHEDLGDPSDSEPLPDVSKEKEE